MKKFFLRFCVTSLLFVSCVTSNARNEDVMTMYMPNSALKYYIRPTKLLSVNSDDYVDIDFTYQMRNGNYISDAYVNFTLHYKTNSYIKNASFKVFPNIEIKLLNITTLDRNTKLEFLRVSTILEKDNVQTVLKHLAEKKAILYLELDDNSKLEFEPSEKTLAALREAFSK